MKPAPLYKRSESYRRTTVCCGLTRVMLALRGITVDHAKSWSEYPCIIWDRSLNRNGYGRMRIGKKLEQVHHTAYKLFYGVIPEGLELDHLCRNRACFHPAHLEAVTHIVNLERGLIGTREKTKTHCPLGHKYTPENTIKDYRNNGRTCRACHYIRVARWHARQKGIN